MDWHGGRVYGSVRAAQCSGVNSRTRITLQARLAQSAERKALNLVVVGLSPTVGVVLFQL